MVSRLTATNPPWTTSSPKWAGSDTCCPRMRTRGRKAVSTWRRITWSSASTASSRQNPCRIAQIAGVDLWTVHSRGNATLSTVVEYLQPYLSDPKKWTKEQITDFSNDGLYFLAYAGMGMKKPEYIALYRKLER